MNGMLPAGAFNQGFLNSLNTGISGPGVEIMGAMPAPTVQPLNVSMPSIATPAAGNPAGWFGIDGLGKNLDTFKLGLGGLQTVAGLWNAFEQNKLARRSFDHQRGILDTNLANSIKSYNLSVDDKFRSRAAFEGTSDADRDAQIARWSARDERKG